MFYPLSKITPDLYTTGNEFVVKASQQSYTGYYFSTFDGKYFTGARPSTISVELVKSTIRETLKEPSYEAAFYNLFNPNQQASSTPLYNHVVPNEQDYSKGYITRYFSKRVNGGPDTIMEISKINSGHLTGNVLYILMNLDWKISGQLYDDFSNLNNPVYGIIDTNRRVLIQKEKEMPGISLYLRDLAQFSKNIL